MLIIQLAIILIASKFAGDISVRLGQPSVLGKLLIGIILGPSFLGLISSTDTLTAFSQIGVILLMFIAGLETDLEQFKRTAKASTLVGIGGIIVPLSLGYAAGNVIGLPSMQSWFLGLLLSATSVSISVQALKEMNKLKSREGATILGAAVIDDVLVIIALAFLMSLAGGDVSLSTVVFKKVVFFSASIFVAWKVVPWFLDKFALLKVTQTVITSALIICFVYAYFAEYAGVAAIIGAYIAGIAISQTKYQHQVFEKVETLSYSLFVPVFFTSIGIAVSFNGLGDNLWVIAGLSVLAIASKLLGSSFAAKSAGFSWNSSLGIGSAMVSRGEVALIIAAIGLDTSLLTQDLFSIVVIVVLVTTIVTPPMMKLFFNKNDESQVSSKEMRNLVS